MTSATTKKQSQRKPARKVVLGVRISKAELDAWDAEHLRSGQTRSEVVRAKLGMGGKPRAARPQLDAEQTYDYLRAMRIRIAVDTVMLMLHSVLELEAEEQIEALGNVMAVVQEQINAVRYEVTALQIRSGRFTKYPEGLEDWPKGVLSCTQT
jgi:hypothetical protein